MAGIRRLVGKATSAEFSAAIKAGKSFPCVLLVGPEDYLRQKDAEAYIESLLPPDRRDFDFTRVAGDAMGVPDMRAALSELPFLGPHRLLCIDSPADLGDEAAAVLKAYLKAPSEALRLLLLEPDGNPREKPLSELLPSLLWIHYGRLKEHQRIDWIISYLQDQGKTITAEAAHYLAQTSTSSLSELAAKLDHAALFVGEVSQVDVFAIQRIAGVTSEVTVYQLEDAFQKGSLSECLGLSKALLEGGETVLRLVSYFHRSLLRLWQIKATSRRRDRDELQRRILGNQYWKRDAFVRAARAMPLATLEKALTGLLDLEIALKTRMPQADILFYHWLWEVMANGHRTTEPATGTRS